MFPKSIRNGITLSGIINQLLVLFNNSISSYLSYQNYFLNFEFYNSILRFKNKLIIKLFLLSFILLLHLYPIHHSIDKQKF
ncbi:MAG: hypothetical protein BAJALOKI2v1_190031 [Promethearchaeota archaeon]|nr:MAG: hypothetical protein BAJALOKI2v1_190031 [Candidatus Lokiarchaeota archaeon]